MIEPKSYGSPWSSVSDHLFILNIKHQKSLFRVYIVMNTNRCHSAVEYTHWVHNTQYTLGIEPRMRWSCRPSLSKQTRCPWHHMAGETILFQSTWPLSYTILFGFMWIEQLWKDECFTTILTNLAAVRKRWSHGKLDTRSSRPRGRARWFSRYSVIGMN